MGRIAAFTILSLAMLMWSFSRYASFYIAPKSLSESVFGPGDVIALPPIYFDLNKCTLRPDKDSVINQSDSLRIVAKFINDHPEFVFIVRNHTDTVNPHSSTRYTACRAESVLKRLIELGADKSRISAQGMGDSEPLKLPQTIILPSGDAVVAEAVLTHRFIATKKANKDDWAYLRMKNRRTDLKVVRTDYSAPSGTTK